MAREKALAILGEEEFIRRQEAVQSEMRTDRFEQRFTLDDIAECRVAGPRQYGFIQFTLRGEAQPDDGDSPCPCRGKGFPVSSSQGAYWTILHRSASGVPSTTRQG